MRSRKAIGWSSVALIMIFAARTAGAQEEKSFSADISAAYAGKYIWRGQNVNDRSVLQPNVAGSAYGFSGSIWANIDLTGESQTAPDNAGEFSEIDYALDYSSRLPGLKKLGVSLGVIHYLFPNTPLRSTTEVYGGLNLNVPLSPRITWYRDVNAIDGSYMEFAVGHTFEVVGKWSGDYCVGLSLSGSLGWAGSGYNRSYYGIDAVKFNDLTIGIGVPFVLRSVSVTPYLNLSTMLSGQVGKATFERRNIWFGVGFSKSFVTE